MTSAAGPASLLDACVRFAAEVSAETVDRVIAAVSASGHGMVGAQVTGDAAQRLADVLGAWQADAPHLSGRDIGQLLCGATHAMFTERRLRRVDLVWSGPATVDSTFRSTGPALLELIGSARQAVYLVTFAAYKVPDVATAIHAALCRGVRVVLVLEQDEVSGGKVSFDPLPFLHGEASLSAEVYGWPLTQRKRDERGRYGSLHAKFAVADRQRLLVSSANLTEFAFDLNIELGVLLFGGSAPGEAVDHIDELIRLGVLRQQCAAPKVS